MGKLGLVTEGASEHRILKKILSVYFKDYDPQIRQLQPDIDETDKQTSPGSWHEVIKWCQNQDALTNALTYNDYLIIQIDTDVSDHRHYDVPKRIGSRQKTHEELFNDVILKLTNLIKTAINESLFSRIVFAICIHSTECWLLPLCYCDNRKNKTTGCLKALNISNRKNNFRSINEEDKNGVISQKAYDSVLSNLKKKKDIINCSIHNYGFKQFVKQLENIELYNDEA